MADCREWMEEISASLDGELSPEEEAALQEHLAECEDCRAAMALLRGMTQVMREDTVQPPAQLAEGTRFLFEREKKEKGFSLKRWRFTAIAAVICLALFGVVKLAPWGAGGSSAAPMAVKRTDVESDVKKSPTAAPALMQNGLMVTAGGAADAAEVPEPAEEPAPAEPETDMRRQAAQNAAAESVPAEDAGAVEAEKDGVGEHEENGAEAEENSLPGAAGDYLTYHTGTYSAESLPGYVIYSQLESAETYYSVCFVYGEVPESVRTNRECTPLEAPEGQERWLVPHSVCVNEGLLEQFNEVYYGDLLSQQGLVIGILDMEEDQWQP